MRKSYVIFLLVCFFTSLTLTSNTVSATTWVGLEPEEVLERAEVIIIGTYDFTSEPQPRQFIFQGFDFNVKSVYKGDIHDQTITAGLDIFDLGWADEFQSEDGEFLLFLENSEYHDFLIPVGGPNGMIQIKNGKVEGFVEESSLFYEDFLETQTARAVDEQSDPENNNLLIFLSVSATALVMRHNDVIKKYGDESIVWDQLQENKKVESLSSIHYCDTG